MCLWILFERKIKLVITGGTPVKQSFKMTQKELQRNHGPLAFMNPMNLFTRVSNELAYKKVKKQKCSPVLSICGPVHHYLPFTTFYLFFVALSTIMILSRYQLAFDPLPELSWDTLIHIRRPRQILVFTRNLFIAPRRKFYIISVLKIIVRINYL